MSRPRLSICIPVYNFAAFLGATLESLLPQATEAVEVIVLDGGSTDGTPALVDGFRSRYPRLQYLRRETRGGIDRDMSLAVAASRGEYVWIFSGDDLMRHDAVARVLAELHSACDLYLLEALLCHLDMTPIAMHRMLPIRAARTFRLGEPADRDWYFRRALNSATFFSFCSALVIRRESWDRGDQGERYFGTCWAHAARLLSLVPSGLTVRYLPGAFLDKRGDNDSFLTDGLTRRWGLAVEGYQRIADETFGHASFEARAIRAAMRRDIPLAAWLLARIEVAESRPGDWPLFRRLVRQHFGDGSPIDALRLAVCLHAPAWALRATRRAVMALRGSGRPQRSKSAPKEPAGS